MAPRWLLLASAGLGSALVACDGSESDATEPAPEAGALIEEDASSSPWTDARPDGPEPVDAARDAAPPAGDGGVFADDFEDGDLADDWEVTNICQGCSGTVDQGAFLAKSKAIDAQESAFAHVRTTVAGAPSRVRLSFDATFPSVTLTKGSLAIATVDVSDNHFFTLYLRDTDTTAAAASLEEQGGTNPRRHLLTSLPPAGTKTRVVIDIDLGSGTAKVSFGGTVALASDPIAKTTADNPTIRVGLMYVYGPQDPFEGRFDDVLLEYY